MVGGLLWNETIVMGLDQVVEGIIGFRLRFANKEQYLCSGIDIVDA